MKDSVTEVAEYFSKRAARYQLSQETCPLARSLDLIPYVFAMENVMRRFSRATGDMRVFDAFGGSGFLSRSFSHTDIEFTIGDCTNAYKPDSSTRHEWVVSPDYFRSISAQRSGQYDLVFAHGGLHHAYVKDEAGVEEEPSIGLQHHCIANLARLLRPGGFFVLADIPVRPFPASYDGREFVSSDPGACADLLGHDRMAFLNAAAPGFVLSPSLRATSCAVNAVFRNPFQAGSLPRFFDEFVALKTPFGHEACFIDFARIIGSASAHGLANICTVTYPGAWLFHDQAQAIWFFREMFGFGASTPPFEISALDADVQSAITDLLGVRNLQARIAVNWGVTYSFFAKY